MNMNRIICNELADVQQNSTDNDRGNNRKCAGLGAIYIKSVNEATQTISTSCQLPPECADPAIANAAECQFVLPA